MIAWLNIDPVYCSQRGVFRIFRFDCNFTIKRESSSWLKCKGSIFNSNRSWISVSHIDVKGCLLNIKSSRRFDEEFPNIFLFGFGKSRLFGCQLSWSVANFDINNTLHHGFNLDKILLPSNLFARRHLVDYFLLQLFVLGLFNDLCSAEWTFFIDQKTFQHAFIAENMVAVCDHRSV